MTKRAKLLPFQSEGVDLIDDFGGRVLLADEMGLGKTFQALEWTRRNEEFPLLIICPAVLKINWYREAWDKCRITSRILYGQRPPRSNSPKGKSILAARALIINYDILYYWRRFLKRYPAKTMIVDECHYIKNGKTKRSLCVGALNRRVDNLIGISGTPLYSRPIELYPILHMLCPRVFPSKTMFAYDFCNPKPDKFGGISFDGCHDRKGLHRLLKKHVMIRRLKKNVLKDLPKKTRIVLPLELPTMGWREYNAASTNILSYLEKTKGADAVKRAQRSQALIRLGVLKQIAAKHKLPQVFEWIDLFLESGKKLVVFCVHRKIAAALHDRYKGTAVLVNGRITGKRRQAAVDAFQNNPATKMLIGNIAAAGVGLTLTAASDALVVELGWTPPEMVQAEDRIHRLTQLEACTIYYAIAIGTVEEAIANILQRKQGDIEAIMDGNATVTDLALVTMIEEELERIKRRRYSA